MTILWILVVFAAVVGFLGKQFRYAPGNPARRWCLECNQQQEQFTRSYDNRDVWWEDMGKVPNPSCKCHRYTEYRF